MHHLAESSALKDRTPGINNQFSGDVPASVGLLHVCCPRLVGATSYGGNPLQEFFAMMFRLRMGEEANRVDCSFLLSWNYSITYESSNICCIICQPIWQQVEAICTSMFGCQLQSWHQLCLTSSLASQLDWFHARMIMDDKESLTSQMCQLIHWQFLDQETASSPESNPIGNTPEAILWPTAVHLARSSALSTALLCQFH